MEWLLNRTSNPGFWRGMVYIATAMGVTLDPTQQSAIIAGGLAIAGLIHAFAPHRA